MVTPAALTFNATCGGSAPSAQTFVVANAGTVNLNWTMSAITGPGAAQYSVNSSAQPGLLIPGASVTVAVSAASVPSPAPNPNPAALAAQITISTDVPFDPPHVVTLSEVPLGDQLALSVGGLHFGQVPIHTTLSQSLTVTNAANPGSRDATFALSLGGTGAAGYSLQPNAGIAAGGSGSETVSFTAAAAGPYPATLTFQTGDALCTPLPNPVVLSGTGTAGALSLSATALAFGTDPKDSAGLVNCGATGLPRSLSLLNVGNQGFNVSSLTLGKGASSPFQLSGPASTLPAQLGIGAATSLTIAPSAIPGSVANPNDASAFSDTLTLTTDAAGDTPHVVTLAMQPRGAVIVAGNPLQTDWTFGTIGAGAIGTFTQRRSKTPANASATCVAQWALLARRSLGCKATRRPWRRRASTALVGQFTPASPNGTVARIKGSSWWPRRPRSASRFRRNGSRRASRCRAPPTRTPSSRCRAARCSRRPTAAERLPAGGQADRC